MHHDERQYALDAYRGVMRAMCLGPVSFPNILSVAIDTLHSRECNAFVTIDNIHDEHLTQGLSRFVKKYKKPAAAILAKALLELGAIVCIDKKLMDEEIFTSDVMRLAHPFTHVPVSFEMHFDNS